tara:strand:+ start:735 stop:941 length:207 start_codon:yes stop_codon:yes gene_type:complete
MKATELADKQKNQIDDTQGVEFDGIINVTNSGFENSDLDMQPSSENLKKKNQKRSLFTDWFKSAYVAD